MKQRGKQAPSPLAMQRCGRLRANAEVVDSAMQVLGGVGIAATTASAASGVTWV
ncbi:hypothetical protein ACLB1R_31940 [Escherichia coli]